MGIRKTGSQMPVTAAKPPSNLVGEKSNSANANIKGGPESNNVNLAKTLSTFKGLEPSNPDPMPKQTTNILNSNDNIKTSICNKDNQEQIPRNNEEFGKSESKSTTKISKSIGGGEKEKKKRGRKCGRRGCPEEGTQLCSRCKTTWYCSVTCSEMFWSEHKATCSQDKERKRKKRELRDQKVSEVD